ncbi:metallophosphoesterase family protein [Alkalicoccus chagannorensis]|uniref:metallophosphoesterase family protein n=1 Tax=Alkalicoccus chagannorensis TaxID=427072 RepID=UPI000407765A|nr:metallophosphoesterase family protein [Alkalicoccus chagannorensis]
MNLLLVGDTHLPKKRRFFDDEVQQEILAADHVIHTGDFTSLEAYQWFESHTSLSAVYGNADEEEVKKRLRPSLEMQAGAWKLAVMHGHEGKGKGAEEHVRRACKETDADIVIFGHSHIPYCRWHGSTLFINPGSLTDSRKVPMRSCVHLDLSVQAPVVAFRYFSGRF